MTLPKIPPTQKKSLAKAPPAPVSVQPKAAKQQQQKTVNKTFQVAVWGGAGEGEKIILYADSGMGKTTLASMLPTPVFAGLDDGGRKIKNPKTGESLKNIPDIETFDDFRVATQQVNLFDDYETLVVDTATILELWALDWVLENIKDDKGNFVKGIEKYGWGKGHRHLYDTMRLPLADFDALIRRGKNVCILCQMQQVEMQYAGGEDYLCDTPKLAPKYGKNVAPAIWGLWNEWSDHVFKINNEGVIAAKDNEKAKVAKATSTGERTIRVHAGEVNYKAKSRTIPYRFPVVSFSDPTDDSIWQYLFDECWRDIPEEGGGE